MGQRKSTTRTPRGREVPVTHEVEACDEVPAEEGQFYVTVTRSRTVEEHLVVDVPEGVSPFDHARKVVENAEQVEYDDQWTLGNERDAEKVTSYKTEVGAY